MLASSVIVSAVVSCLALLHAAQAEPERARLCVSVVSQVDARVLDLRTLESEVNRIWTPHGIHIDGVRRPCTAAAGVNAPTIELRLRSARGEAQPGNAPPHVLGSIYFLDGVPQPVIDLWTDEAMRIMGGNDMTSARFQAGGPARVELARLLARSLAHELGHYLLATASHTESGLMRRHFGPWDARTADMTVFALDLAQLDALQQTLASWRGGESSPADGGAPAARQTRAVAAITTTR